MRLTTSFKNRIEQSPDFFLFREVIFPKVMKWEGGSKLHKLKGDNGGWTKWGIAYNYWKEIFNDFEDFKDTTLEEAIYFSYDKFYSIIRADLIPHDAKLYYFDTAYNIGTKRAIKMMQKCVGVNPDGVIGPITKAHMSFLKEECLKKEREKYYKTLAGRYSKLKLFLKGWLNRSYNIYKYKY